MLGHTKTCRLYASPGGRWLLAQQLAPDTAVLFAMGLRASSAPTAPDGAVNWAATNPLHGQYAGLRELFVPGAVCCMSEGRHLTTCSCATCGLPVANGIPIS